MKKSYKDLLCATHAEVETIRNQDAVYKRKKLTPDQLVKLRHHLDTLYPACRVQKNFAYNIYMRAG